MEPYSQNQSDQTLLEPQSALFKPTADMEEDSPSFIRRPLGSSRPAAVCTKKRSDSSGSAPLSPDNGGEHIQVHKKNTYGINRTQSQLFPDTLKDTNLPLIASKSKEVEEDDCDAAAQPIQNSQVSTQLASTEDAQSNPSTFATAKQIVKSCTIGKSSIDELDDERQTPDGNTSQNFFELSSTPGRTNDALGGSIRLTKLKHNQLLLSNNTKSEFLPKPISILDSECRNDKVFYNQHQAPDDASDLEKMFHTFLDNENMHQVEVSQFLDGKKTFKDNDSQLASILRRKNSQLSMSGTSSLRERRQMKMQHQSIKCFTSPMAVAKSSSQVQQPSNLATKLEVQQSVDSVSTVNEAKLRFSKLRCEVSDSASLKN